MRQDLAGTALVLLSAAAFGTMAVLVKLAFAEGATAETILALRFGVAALALWLLVLVRGHPRALSLEKLAHLALLAGISCAFQLCLFAALARIPASLTVILLYTFPATVAILSHLVRTDRMTIKRAGTLVLCLGGTFLLVGGPGGALDGAGVALGLAAAVAYAVYVVASGRLFVDLATEVGVAYIVLFTAIMLTAYGFIADGVDLSLTPRAIALILALGLGSTAVSLSAFFAGLRRIGPVRTSIISTMEPLVAVGLSVAVLGETMTALQILGGGVVLVGVLLLHLPARAPEGERAEPSPAP